MQYANQSRDFIPSGVERGGGLVRANGANNFSDGLVNSCQQEEEEEEEEESKEEER